MRSQELSLTLPDLMDITKAIDVGKLLTANYILTGNVMRMPSLMVIFGSIINVEIGKIELVALVIILKNKEVKALL